jgi:hypothetical protein
MTKLAEDEVVQLLRETFAEKENLVDRLPEAISRPTRRWEMPAKGWLSLKIFDAPHQGAGAIPSTNAAAVR